MSRAPRSLFTLAVLLAGAAHAQAPAPAAAPVRPVALTAERGDLRLTLSDGRVMHGAELVGASLTIGGQQVRIAAAQPDPEDRAGEVWLFDLRLPDDSRFCSPAPDGGQWAMPIPDASAPAGFGLTCTSGAAGKCVRFGYAPWRMAPDSRTSLAPYHTACGNMLRGAYGGPERPWTRDGMRIDLYDHIGLQQPFNDPGQRFEAGWTPEGAVCVAHPRVPENGSLADIAAAHPQLAGRTGPVACTEEAARAAGALVFNRSTPPVP
jgi:hypothetical protein